MDSTIDYKIITSIEGQNNYARAVAEGLIEFLGLKKKSTVTLPSAPKPATEKINVVYQIHDIKEKVWLPNVTNNSDYAGIFGHSVDGVFAKLSKGNIYYKVHIIGDKK